MTDAEQLLWRHLRSRQLAGRKFRRQQPMGRFIVDFVCFGKRLVIELDGGQHSEPIQSAYDMGRTIWLENEGYRVLRFWDHDVLKNLDSVKEVIFQAVT
jgi:very-short-patch-repair endonuclease